MTLPGKPVGAGRALTVGEKELAPPGPTAFSVGAGAFDGVAGALDSGDFVVSAGFSFSVAHADSAPIPTMASAPVASANRLAKRVYIIVFSPNPYALRFGLLISQLYVGACCSALPHRRGLPTQPARLAR